MRRPKPKKPQVKVSSAELRNRAEEFYYYLDQIARVIDVSEANLRKNYIIVAGENTDAFMVRKIRAIRRGKRLVVLESEFFRWLKMHGVDPRKIDVPVRSKLYRISVVAEKLGISIAALRRSQKVRLYYAGLEDQIPYTPDMLLCFSIAHKNRRGGDTTLRLDSNRWRVSEEELRRWMQHTNMEVLG